MPIMEFEREQSQKHVFPYSHDVQNHDRAPDKTHIVSPRRHNEPSSQTNNATVDGAADKPSPPKTLAVDFLESSGNCAECCGQSDEQDEHQRVIFPIHFDTVFELCPVESRLNRGGPPDRVDSILAGWLGAWNSAPRTRRRALFCERLT